jgi:hypothetical protein
MSELVPLMRMKKLTAIFLLLIYTSAAYGITISRHLCKGHVVGVSILNFSKPADCCCAMQDTPKDCCQNDIKKAHTEDHQSVPLIAFAGSLSAIVLENGFHLFTSLSPWIVQQNNAPFIPDDTPKLKTPLFLFFHVFRI